MPFHATSLVFMLAALAVLAPVRSAPTFQARQDAPSASATPTMTPTAAVADSSSTATTSSADFVKQNGLDAQKLNAQFAKMTVNDTCTEGQMACVTGAFAQCVSGKWVLSPCSATLSCFALPLIRKAGTSIVCDSQADATSRFAAAGVDGGIDGAGASTASATATATASTSTATEGSTTAGDDCDDDGTTPDPTSGEGDDCDDDSGTNSTPDGDADCDDGTTATASGTPITAHSAMPTDATVTPAAGSASQTASATEVQRIITLQAAVPSDPATITLQAAVPSATASVESLGTVTIPSNYNYRRQVASSVVASPTDTLFTPAVPTAIIAATTPTAPIVTPTVHIGTDGIVTVTVVSTVFATNCGASATAAPSATILPTIVTPAVPTVPSNTVVAASGPPIITLATATPSASATPGAIIILTPASAAASATPTPAAGGFSFSTGGFGDATASPAPAQTGTANLSNLLTATIGGY